METSRKIKIFGCCLAVLILIITSLFHITGYSTVSQFSANLEQDGMIKLAIPALWIMPTIHWITMAIIVMLAITKVKSALNYMVLLIGLVILADAIVLFLHVGPFIGELLLATAGFLCLIGWYISK